jgi:hypothetical protein
MHGIFVRRGMNGDGLDTHFPTGTDDAQGNFAAIGNEDF